MKPFKASETTLFFNTRDEMVRVRLERVAYLETDAAALAEGVTAPVLARHIAEAIGYRALDRPSNFGVAF